MREKLLARCQAVQDRLQRCEWDGAFPKDVEVSIVLTKLLKAEHALDEGGPAQIGLWGPSWYDEEQLIERAEKLAEEKGL